MKMSKIAPKFEHTTKASFGLKHMEEEKVSMPMRGTVQMQTEPVKPLTGIKPMGKNKTSYSPWKPKGRK
jgi:hypothetical protein